MSNGNSVASKDTAPSRLSLQLLLTSAVLLLAVYTFTDPRSISNPPVSYVLCSKEGNNVYTVDSDNSQTQCIVVVGAFIADRGSLSDITGRWNKFSLDKLIFRRPSLETRFIQSGAIILPGLSDSHAHILEYGATQQLPLEGTKTVQDTVARVRNFILANPDIHNDTSKFVIGGGWDHTIWPTAGWPTSAHLDEDPVIRDRPVILHSKDCHALWASSRAIKASMPFPDEVDGGVIIRDGAGNPTGVFLDNAQELLRQPQPTEADLVQRFRLAVKDAHASGLTTVHDAGLDPASLAFFRRYL
ncbi:hypothetical protein C0992_006174 [Termitomyces sp. T32_za158]|nr:hypothetical protein C0992_006174 [Termitomyces sp. T32_za158]